MQQLFQKKIELDVLSVASEFFPLVKTGGLGDVTGALPAALAPQGVRVRTVLPGYPSVMNTLKWAHHEREKIEIQELGHTVHIIQASIEHNYFFIIDCTELYLRSGSPYTAGNGKSWDDNGLRFALLSRVAARLACGLVADYQPDLVLAHDWPAGLTAAYLHFTPGMTPPVVQTIHNIAFQGRFGADQLSSFELPVEGFSQNGFEFHGDIGFLKAGLYYARWLIAVSPNYAEEIQTAEFGMGLEGLLHSRSANLSGILNGVDTDVWNPETDPDIHFPYKPGNVWTRRSNKAAFQAEFGLAQNPDALLIGVVSRLTDQKGIDLLAEAMPVLMRQNYALQCVVVGGGELHIERQLGHLARRFPGRFACTLRYSESLGHRAQASADVIFVPSRFEPCGLTQLYAMRYGAVPVVSKVGGLADTIIDANAAALSAGCATGFVFSPNDATAIINVMQRVYKVFCDKALWTLLQRNGAQQDVSWQRPAALYGALFKRLVPSHHSNQADVLAFNAKAATGKRSIARRPPLAGSERSVS
ncbi:glycogen synthase GlgA [Acetobacter senegalensis]|uniref:glycogen synthase GlgA n=1 Tax=Acetobacter senegalensis TaxID=446692 RepID=UPI00128E2733|nr:glycogen synthase GlgA [Acetobacter senegalensis]MCG4257846.1 glycogen synthase GlgA [Acetobacter senegalensis]MCG4267249.1 glycogen synthase GlgA [Acetobacter senegalensis]MPQ75397.1 glycogen synthase GlgA [Acetobacter senegalensis]